MFIKLLLISIFRFLATGESLRSLAFQFRVSHQYISTIVREVSSAVRSQLLAEALPAPTTEALEENERKFCQRWNYPNCVGAIDGKHVRIVCPANTGSAHFNYKDFFSTVLLAIVGPEYKYVAIDVGAYGREGDSGIFHRSTFGKSIYDGTFVFPPPKNLPGTDTVANHVIVGDEAFTLHANVMRSYPRRQALTERRKAIYNYRHSRARRTTENTFGIMGSYFRIFHTPINLKTETVDDVVVLACIFHNMMREEKILSPVETTFNDVENINSPPSLYSLTSSRSRPNDIGYQMREIFTDYFNGIGRVEWQDNRLLTH